MKKLFGYMRQNNGRKLKALTTLLAAIVVFATTYSIILPAVTIENDVASQEPGLVLAEESIGAPDAAEGEVTEADEDTGAFFEHEAVLADAADAGQESEAFGVDPKATVQAAATLAEVQSIEASENGQSGEEQAAELTAPAKGHAAAADQTPDSGTAPAQDEALPQSQISDTPVQEETLPQPQSPDTPAQDEALQEPQSPATPAQEEPAPADTPVKAPADTNAINDDVSYAVSTEKNTDEAGKELTVNVHAEVPSEGELSGKRYVYILMDKSNAHCTELQDKSANETVEVTDQSGKNVILHVMGDGFWFELDAENGETVDIPLHFNSEEVSDESQMQSVHLYAGAGYYLYSGFGLSAYNNARQNQFLSEFGWADPETCVNLSWTQAEVDQEPVWDDEFSVSADQIYGYFNTVLDADFHAQAGRGSENNVFYVRQSANRSELKILQNANPGDIVPAVDNDGNPITDRYGEQLKLHVTDDGFWFELDNSKHNNFANFTLGYKAADDASQTISNAAKMRLYLAQDADADAAQAAAGEKFSPNLALTWSDTGDKLQYEINLIWDTSIEEHKYDQNVVTTSQSTLSPKYVLDLLTSSANYEAEQFRIELPYALWAYRDSKNGNNCSIPTDISIPKEGDALNGSLFHYHIEYDETAPKDLTKAKLVITNAAYLPAGTNARITTKYSVDPWRTVDLSTSEITAMVTAQATNQSAPELGESNTITYRLDTGFDSCSLRKTSTWTSMDAAAVYQKPTNLDSSLWDPDHYNMVMFHINYGVSSYNQPLDLDFLTTLPEGAELVVVSPHVGGFQPIAINKDTGTWEREITSKSLSSSDGDDWFYVRFPRTGDEETDYHVRLDMEVTAHDDDSHTPPEDYNDTGHRYLEWNFHWKDYEFNPTGTETYAKFGWGDDYIEAVKAGSTDVEFDWRMYLSTNRWYLEDGETQYVQLTDDAHFWEYVPASYSTNDWKKVSDMHWMSEDSWEFSRITSIYFQYSDLSHRDGSTIYPDFNGGDLLIQASKDGVTWDTVKTVAVPAATGRTGASIPVPDSGKFTFEKGSGYTRLRVISPEVGRGNLHIEVNFYTRLKGDSSLIRQWLEECSDTQKVYVRNYAAYQHFSRLYKTETKTDPETGETVTKKTDELGEYIWDDQLSKPYPFVANDGASDKFTLADRDVKDHQYYTGNADGYVRRVYANGQLRHFTYGAQLRKTTGDTVNDTANQRAIVPFAIFEEERVSGKSGEQYTEIYKDFSQESGIFYDLLPPGYRYLEGSADGQSVTGLNAPVTVETVDDFRGSGRQMVKFSISKQADPAKYTTASDTNLKNPPYSGYLFGKTKETQVKLSSIGNLYTGFYIEFKAYIPWKNLVDHPSEVNLVSFQRTDGQPIRAGASDQGYPNRERNFSTSDSQTIKEFKGTAAKSRKIDYDKSTTAAFDDDFSASGGVRGSGPSVFTDVDGDGKVTDKTSLYAYSGVNPQVVDGVQTGITKEILGDEGKAAAAEGEEGWRGLDRTKLNESYSYRITAYASMGQMYGLIIYDTLENAQNKEGASGEVTWKGKFDSIDVSEAVELGFDPVVYYSTVPGLDYNSITGKDRVIWIEDTSIWSTQCPEDRSAVTAIAVDLRKMADGSDAILRSKSGEDDPEPDRVSVIVNMTAPDVYQQPNAIYAINRPAYSCYQKGFFSAEEMHKSDIGLRVKIYLPAELRIRKNSIGGKNTPDSAKFTLTFPNGYRYSFTYGEFDENGEFVLNDEKLEEIRKKSNNPSKVPAYVDTGTYTVTEDTESARVDDILPEVTYNGGDTCSFTLAGKTNDDDAPEEQQNVIRIINDYGGEEVTLQIAKVDTDDMTSPVPGAEFTLTAIDPAATAVSELTGDNAYSENKLSGSDGHLAFDQLPAGCYILSETSAPDGYILAENSTVYLKVKNGTVTLLQRTEGKAVGDWDELALAPGESLRFDSASQTLTIGNTKGIGLPSTGGAGTGMFTIIGGLLIAAGIFLIMRKTVRPR